MSKVKKIVLSLLTVAALVAGAAGLKYHQEGLPILKNRCFIDLQSQVVLVVLDVIKLPDENGKEVEVYEAGFIAGFRQVPMLLDIRKANKMIPKALEEGKLEEVNCETGAALSQ